jgi:hypothetical protein
MPKGILRERIYFSGAESLYAELEALDPAFRRAAGIVDVDYEDVLTFSGGYRQYTMILEAEIDVSP